MTKHDAHTICVAKAIAQTGSKMWYDEGDEYSEGFIELATAAIAASDAKYLPMLVKAAQGVLPYLMTDNVSAQGQAYHRLVQAINYLPDRITNAD